MKISRHRFLFFLIALAIVGGIVWWRLKSPAIVNEKPAGSQIIALGDSLTTGVGASSGHDYVTLLSQKIGRPILNRGVLGDTTAGALSRLEKDVLSQAPQIVIVFLGGNDVLRKIPPEQTFGNLDQIVRRIQEQGAMVVLVEFRPPPLGLRYGKEFRRLARQRGAVLVPNVFREIFSDPKMKYDQIHFNDQGYAIVATRIYEAVKSFLP